MAWTLSAIVALVDEPSLARGGTVSLSLGSFLRELLARADYSTSATLCASRPAFPLFLVRSRMTARSLYSYKQEGPQVPQLSWRCPNLRPVLRILLSKTTTYEACAEKNTNDWWPESRPEGGPFCPAFRKQFRNLLKRLVFGVTSNDSFGSGPSDVGLVVEPGVGKAAQS